MGLKLIKQAVILGLLLMLLVGCSSSGKDGAAQGQNQSNAKESSNAEGKKLEPVTLKIMLPGNRPRDMDKVIAEAEKRMEGTLNVKLDVAFIPWTDLGNKTQVALSSGESVDLIFDAPWLHIRQMIGAGYYEPLDGLIEKYGSNINKVRPELMWNANKFDGKIMAIPLGAFHNAGKSYAIRKDIREKLGLPPIKTYDDLVKFWYAVKEKEPGIIPFTTEKQSADFAESIVRIKRDLNVRVTHAFGQNLVLYYKGNDGKVNNLFDKMDPEIWNYIKNSRKLYQDKIINQDLMASPSMVDMFLNGKAASFILADVVKDRFWAADLAKNIKGAEMEILPLDDFTPKKNISNFLQWNFIAVPKVSKNKERAIMFLNWANQKENFDLLAYGIEGVNWKAVGDRKFEPMGDGYSYFPYAWIWNPTQERLDANFTPEETMRREFLMNADNFTPDILTGFSFNTESIQNELALHNTLESKYLVLIMNGVVDPEKSWEEYKKEAAPTVKKIQEELQKQIEVFLANKK